MKKYEFTDKVKHVHGITLHRIRYIKTGMLGGWLQSEKNLSQTGDAWVFDNAQIYGKAQVYGDAVTGNAQVSGNKHLR